MSFLVGFSDELMKIATSGRSEIEDLVKRRRALRAKHRASREKGREKRQAEGDRLIDEYFKRKKA